MGARGREEGWGGFLLWLGCWLEMHGEPAWIAASVPQGEDTSAMSLDGPLVCMTPGKRILLLLSLIFWI